MVAVSLSLVKDVSQFAEGSAVLLLVSSLLLGQKGSPVSWSRAIVIN